MNFSRVIPELLFALLLKTKEIMSGEMSECQEESCFAQHERHSEQ